MQLAEECDDQHLAERLKAMAANLLAKAEDLKELPNERIRHQDRKWSLAS